MSETNAEIIEGGNPFDEGTLEGRRSTDTNDENTPGSPFVRGVIMHLSEVVDRLTEE